MTEAKHQATVFKWARQPSVRAKWPELALLHHIPNGGSRDAVEGRHLREQGVKPGVPDLHLPVARGKYHSLYIEMKNEDGKTSPEQDWWGERLATEGNMWEVCHGWRHAIRVLEWYLTLSRPQ